MKKIRLHLVVFVILLALSGISAFPVRSEVDFLATHRDAFPGFMLQWIMKLERVIAATPDVMLYGTDWLAFAHLVIALFFIPVYLDPLKHKINLQIAMVACIMVFPLAFICGPIRDIPFFHQLIDCSFGLLGFLYLSYLVRRINQLKTKTHENID